MHSIFVLITFAASGYSGYTVAVFQAMNIRLLLLPPVQPAGGGFGGRDVLSRGVLEVIDVHNSSAVGAPQIENPAALKKTRSF